MIVVSWLSIALENSCQASSKRVTRMNKLENQASDRLRAAETYIANTDEYSKGLNSEENKGPMPPGP